MSFKNYCFFTILTAFFFFFLACGGDDTVSESSSPNPLIRANKSSIVFGNTMVSKSSESVSVFVESKNVNSESTISSSDAFEISFNNIEFFNTLSLGINQSKNLYVRFKPTEIKSYTGVLKIENSLAPNVNVNLSGDGIQLRYNYLTFSNKRLAFGSGYSQSSSQNFDLHNDLSNIESVKMYVKLRCPSVGCNAWDVYANIYVKDPQSSKWLEIGRYITPYGVDNSKLDRGSEIDVTDFKSLLVGNVELKAFIEVWGSDGWNLSVDFDYLDGKPDYKNYAITPIIQYNSNSLNGVVYGEDQSDFDLDKSISVGENIEKAHLRTIITGWGHATPNDPDGRGCAEWCFRTHSIKIDDVEKFNHYLGPIGCASNPVNPQSGNWSPDRAGWCPGMSVPLRIDNLDSNISNANFNFEYTFAPWVNNLKYDGQNPHAYYAISSFIVLKSNSEINPAIVSD